MLLLTFMHMGNSVVHLFACSLGGVKRKMLWERKCFLFVYSKISSTFTLSNSHARVLVVGVPELRLFQMKCVSIRVAHVRYVSCPKCHQSASSTASATLFRLRWWKPAVLSSLSCSLAVRWYWGFLTRRTPYVVTCMWLCECECVCARAWVSEWVTVFAFCRLLRQSSSRRTGPYGWKNALKSIRWWRTYIIWWRSSWARFACSIWLSQPLDKITRGSKKKLRLKKLSRSPEYLIFPAITTIEEQRADIPWFV